MIKDAKGFLKMGGEMLDELKKTTPVKVKQFNPYHYNRQMKRIRRQMRIT